MLFRAKYRVFLGFPQCADRQAVGRKESVLMSFFFLRNGLSGTPDTSGRHDGGVLTVRQNAFSCPVIMFPQHRGMAFTGMCFNLKLLIAGTLTQLGGSGADGA